MADFWSVILSFGRAVQSLYSFRLRDSGLQDTTPLGRDGVVDQSPRRTWRRSIDLSLMLADFTGGFKGLPQEIVDEILEYLERDQQTLKACSLTCKGLFRSVRRIIHRRLRVVGPRRPVTAGDQEVQRRRAANRSQLRILSEAAKGGLSRYTRDLTIRVGEEFTPENLRPYLSPFQTFAQLTSLTLHHFNPAPFLPVFDQYFGHLALQMRSLRFIYSPGAQNDMMYFISQFPNLEDLGFNPFPQHNLEPSIEYDISSFRKSPTLGGTLQVTSTNAWRTNSFEPLTRLPSGLRFRSIVFLHCTGIDPDVMIRECASTLESLTHVFHTYGAVLRFDLSTCSRLRTFELRLELLFHVFRDFVLWLASVISTIASPTFGSFVLVVESTNFHPLFRRIDGKNAWELVDRALLSLSQQTGMKMIVKGRALHYTFRKAIEDSFPFMMSAGMIEFEPHDTLLHTHCPVTWPII